MRIHNLVRRPVGRAPTLRPVGVLPPTFERGWEKALIIASGPSLSQSFHVLQDPLKITAHGWRTIVINTSFRVAPWADILYAGDGAWWDKHLDEVQAAFKGECWTTNLRRAHIHRLHFVRCSDEPGLTTKEHIVFSGSNSGYQAINLAYLFGARRIALVGFDMQRTFGMSHWHGDHPSPLNPDMPIDSWIKKFEALSRDCVARGVEVVNCSVHTALQCFPRQELTSCLFESNA